MIMVLGILILLFGALMPSLLFPGQNPILVGFVGAPFVLFGFILMLIGSFRPQRLDDKRRGPKDGPPGPDDPQ